MDTLKIVINLPSRKDRRREMEHQLHRIGWEADFFEAIRPDHDGGFPTIGARGCYLSHLACLELALSRNARHLILMEDDLNFATDFTAAWAAISHFIENSDFDLLYAGHRFVRSGRGIFQLQQNELATAAHFLIFSISGIHRATAGLREILSRPPADPRGGPMHVDGAYSTIRAQNSAFLSFACFPSLGYQRSSRTDIHKHGPFDRFAPLAPAIRIARRARNYFGQSCG